MAHRVYELDITATRTCVDEPPYNVYVGVTGLTVEERRQNHVDGYKSNVVKRGYVSGRGDPTGIRARFLGGRHEGGGRAC